MAKKVKAKKVNTKKISNGNEMANFIKMIIIVTIIFCIFYVLTVFINRKDEVETPNNNDSNVTIQYDEILIGNIFEQPNDNYYVLIEDIEDINVRVYEAYLSTYSQKEDAKRYYTAVLNNMFNDKYLSNVSNLTDDISKFKVSKTTLLEISKGKIVKYYEKDEDILNVLKEIVKVEEEK